VQYTLKNVHMPASMVATVALSGFAKRTEPSLCRFDDMRWPDRKWCNRQRRFAVKPYS
jgi:hypothetical protein